MKQIDIPITMTSKGTFTLPAKVRKDFGLHSKGDKLMLTYQPGSRRAELKAPLNLSDIQRRIDNLIPDDVAPLADVRGFITESKRTKYGAQ